MDDSSLFTKIPLYLPYKISQNNANDKLDSQL